MVDASMSLAKACAIEQTHKLRQQLYTPPAFAARPVVLSNTKMLQDGQSLSYIVHRQIPMCVMGYSH